MAVFLPGPMVSEVRGSQGGTVFSRNKGGAYTRFRAVPVNPQTARQEVAREALTAASQDWSVTLTPTQRTAWNTAAEELDIATSTNLVGSPIRLTGQQFFVRINAAMYASGNFGVSGLITTPPSVGPEGAIAAFQITEYALSTPTVTMTLTLGPALGASEVVDIFATPPLGAGTSNGRTNQMRWLGQNATWAAADVADAYELKYGAPPLGTKIGFGARVRDILAGSFGPIFATGPALVVAGA